MKKVKFITKNTLTGEEGTRMTITNDGKIGIGTETPGKILDVSGDINFTGNLFQNGQAFTSGADLATSSISELADVNLTGIATNQGLKWDGTKLIPTSLSTGGGGGGGFTDLTTFLISDLSNVNLSGITAGQGIQWDGAKIVPADATTKMASLVPLANNTYSLGTPTNVWKDVYIGPGSLYIDGQKVIESDSNTIIMGADANQNLKLKGSGTGQIQIETTSNNINIQTIGTGDVVLGSTGSGTVKITKNISLLDGVEIQNIGGTNVIVNDNLDVTGIVNSSGFTTMGTMDALSFNIGGTNVISTLRQISCTELEATGDISTNSLTVNGVQVTGGGANITTSSITDLSDVDISYSNISNGSYLTWNDTDKKWEAFNPTNTSSERSSIETRVSHSTSDVAATTSSQGEFYQSYDFGKVFDDISNNNISVVHSDDSPIVYNNGTYNGSTPSTNGYTGMWVQQEYNTAIYFTKFKIHLRDPASNMSPQEFKVFVGNDGSNWNQFGDTITLPNNNPGAKEIIFQNTDTPYTFIRFVFHSTFGDPYMSFRELEIFGNKKTTVTSLSITNQSIKNLNDVDISYSTISDGQALVWNDASGVWQPGNVAAGGGGGGSTTTVTKQGQVLETLTGIADGRTVIVESGSYTLTNVTDTQISTTSYTDITGTSIDYTPPTGTKQVIFTYHINMSMEQGTQPASDGNNKRGLILIQMTIDDEVVTNQIQAWGDDTNTYGESFKYKGIIDINGTNDASNGSLASWSTSKTVKLRFISYAAGYHVRLHANQYGEIGTNNTVTNTLIKPRIEINSIGEETTTSGGGGSSIDNTTDVSLNNLAVFGDISGSATSSIKFVGETQITVTNIKLKSWVVDNSGTFDISHVGYQSSGSEGTNWPKPRQEHSTIMDNSNNIIIFGGKDSENNHLSDIWEYDIGANTYTKKVSTLQTTGTSSIKPTYSSDNTWLPYENLSTTGFINERSDNRSMAAYDNKLYYLTDTQLWIKDLTQTVDSPSTAGNTNWSQVTGITGSGPNNSKRGAFFYHNDSGTDYLYYLFGVIDDDTSPETGDFNTSAYRFNISTKTWSSTSATYSTTDYKRMYSAFHVYDGYCFAYGGNVNASNYSNTFVKVGLGGSGDKAFGYCSTLSPSAESGSNAITGRTYVSWAGQGKYMYIIGGRASNGNTQKCIFRYDCANNTYRQITSTSDGIVDKLHWEEGVAGIYNNKLIMASSYNAGTSGATNYLLSVDISTTSNSYSLAYYPDNNNLTDSSRRINTEANNSVGAAAAWIVYKNRWYFMFPYGTGINSDGSYTDSVDFSNGFGGGISPYMWTYVFADYQGTTTYDLANHTCNLHNNNMYIFGGKNSSNTYANNLLRISLSDYTFSSLTVSSRPSIRDSHSSVTLNDKIYIFGGWNGSTVNNETWELDLSTDPPTSTQKQSNVISAANINRYGHSAVIYDGNMYIFGGHDGANLHNTIYKYDITNNSWTLMATNGTSPSARYYHTAFVTKDEMIVYGGKDAADATVQDSFLFDFNNRTWYSLNNDATTTHTPSSASIPNYSYGADAIHYNSGNDYKIYLYGGYNSQNTTLLGGNGIIQTSDISHNQTEYATTEEAIAFTFNTDNTGKVGIGKLTPTKTLDVGGDINFSGSLYRNGNVVNIGSSTFNQHTDLTINSLTTVNDINFSGNLYQNGTLFTGGTTIDSTTDISVNHLDVSSNLTVDGRIAIGKDILSGQNATLDVSGNGNFSGLVTADGNVLSSDDRIKHNETIPTTPLNTIMKLTPKHYFKTRTMYDVSHNFTVDASGYPVDFSNNRLVEGKDYTRETGIIAQDLQAIPELNYIVKVNGVNEPLGVDYNSIHCTHIAATKELHSMVKSQQTIIDDHVKKINALTTLYAVQKQKTENLENALAAIRQHLGI